jgi:hypothetical protein
LLKDRVTIGLVCGHAQTAAVQLLLVEQEKPMSC